MVKRSKFEILMNLYVLDNRDSEKAFGGQDIVFVCVCANITQKWNDLET